MCLGPESGVLSGQALTISGICTEYIWSSYLCICSTSRATVRTHASCQECILTALPMEAAKLLEFDLNCSLIELSHKLRRGWASSNHSQKNVDQWHRSSHSPGKRKLLARCDCDNTPPSVWKGRSRRWSLKNYLRSTMGKDRLTGVGIAIHVNKSTEVDPDDIVELYASKKERRIRILWF